MATRDYTLVFQRLRSTFHRKYELLPLSTEPTLNDGITASIEELDQLIKKLGVLHAEHHKIFNIDLQKNKELEIESLSSSVNSKINELLKSIKSLSNNSIVDKNTQKALFLKLSDKLTFYRKIQNLYIDEIKKQQLSTFMPNLHSNESDHELLHDSQDTQADLSIIMESENMTNERILQINRLSKSIEELANLFRDLNTLILEQGTMLDRIDYNIESAVNSSTQAKTELVTAETYQKSSRPTWCIISLLALILIMVIIIIIKASS